ncbi:MAG: UbiA family prenyltransferase [Chitinophagales bacterium]|nr:UbiA family prenyltransferase [Chitinophagales bacterium]
MKVAHILRFVFNPLLLRLQLGEGGITLFNTVHCWLATHNPLLTTGCTALSLLTLCALYGFNDYIDRHRDAQNPKKHQPFVALINEHNKAFLITNALLSAALVLTALAFYGTTQAASLLLLLGINCIYSLRLKTLPLADIVIVTLWGSAITLLVPVIHLPLSLVAGIMTGIAHIYQMLGDKESDTQNGVTTAITRYPKTASVQILLLCLLLGVSIYWLRQNILWSATAVLPFVCYYLIKKNETAWLFSRLYFAIVWLMLLYNTYGGN